MTTDSTPKAALTDIPESAKKMSYGIIKRILNHVYEHAPYYLILVLGFCLGLLVHV
jgi:hypothetical protein